MPGCTFETEFLPNEAAVECLKIHVNLHHHRTEEKPSTNDDKAVFKVSKCNVVYKKNQSFEAFEKELNKWKESVKNLRAHTKDMMFVEAISSAEDPDIKEFYSKNVMNNESIPKTLESVMENLMDKFGKSDKNMGFSVL